MGATAVNKKLNIIDRTSTIREIKLYSDVTKFVDYDDGGYFSVHDGNAYRYAYCSSRLYTNSEGNPTSCLICEFIGKDGNLRYMYTQQPNETEELYRTITSNVTDTTLMTEEDNEFGCYVYLVNTKGANGKSGENGGSGIITHYNKYGKPDRGVDGYGGNGGAGGSAGVSVNTSLTLNGSSSLYASLEGMCGAGGGGGGGGGCFSGGTTSPGGYGGPGGTANNVSKAYKIRICNGNSITGSVTRSIDNNLNGKNGFAGQTGYWNDNDGGMGGTSGDGNGGGLGGDGKISRGGHGGYGGNAGSSRAGNISGTGTNRVLTAENFDSSTNIFSNSIASTGGVVITKIIASFSD